MKYLAIYAFAYAAIIVASLLLNSHSPELCWFWMSCLILGNLVLVGMLWVATSARKKP